MSGIAYLALAGLVLVLGVPTALMAACGLAQLRLAQRLNPCAFALPVSSGLALGLALYVKSRQSGLGLLLAQVLAYWTEGAFAGSAAGWAAVYAARYRRMGQRGDGTWVADPVCPGPAEPHAGAMAGAEVDGAAAAAPAAGAAGSPGVPVASGLAAAPRSL